MSVQVDTDSLEANTKTLIGIGITTTPNRDCLDTTLKEWQARLPEGARIAIYEDEKFEGISVAKNKLLEELAGCDHIFLADDDTYPITDNWWEPYVTSAQPHLQYNFTTGPDHWSLDIVSHWAGHVSYTKSRGCMLYIERRVLDVVGGMHNVFGKHGREHEDWSERIHRAGLTKHPFQDVDTKNFYCMDEDQKGISSVKFSDHQGWRHIDTSKLPLYAEYKTCAVPMLVARRNDNGHRDRLWRFLKENYWGDQRIVEGYHKDGAFNRSLGLNTASTLAGNWHVAVFIDSDAYIQPAKLQEAIELAVKEQKVVLPFNRVIELTPDATFEVLASKRLIAKPEQDQIEKIRTAEIVTQSLFVVVPRNVYEQVNGFDERFVGWGGEDNAFYKACSIVSGTPIRLEGDVYHLWHEPASRQHQPQNNRRYMQYMRANSRQELLWLQKGL